LVGIALALVLGLFLQQIFSAGVFLWLGLSAIFLGWSLWFRGRCSTGLFLLSISLLAAAYNSERQSSSHLLVAEPVGSTRVNGHVVDSSAQSSLFKIDAVEVSGRWYESSALVRLYSGGAEQPVCGERWILNGEIHTYGKTYSGVSGTFRFDAQTSVRQSRPVRSIRTWLHALRERAGQALENGSRRFPQRISLLKALLLGERQGLPDPWRRMFSRTGTLHIFAISGLHVGLVASILIAILKLCGVSRPRWGMFLIPLLLLYVATTGMKASALRAFTMAAVYFSAPLFRRKPDPVSAIALAAIILLLIRPSQLADPGFLLSFTVVSGIVMVHRFVTRLQRGFHAPWWTSPLASLHAGHPARALVRTVGVMALTSAAAWLFAFPLSAYFFNTLSPVAIIGNLLLVPFTFLIVLAGFLAISFTAVFPAFTELLNEANELLVGGLIQVVEWLISLPRAYWFVRSPSWSILAIWYGGLVIFLCGARTVRRQGGLLVLLAVGLWVGQAMDVPRQLSVYRDGDCAVFVSSPNRKLLMIDGSSYSMARAERMMKKKGINQVDNLWIKSRVHDTDDLNEFCSLFDVVPEYGRSLRVPCGDGTLCSGL
jgi:ComEC/Rec2-related protein